MKDEKSVRNIKEQSNIAVNVENYFLKAKNIVLSSFIMFFLYFRAIEQPVPLIDIVSSQNYLLYWEKVEM